MPSSSLLFHFVRLAVVIDAGILRNSIAGGKNATGLPLTTNFIAIAYLRMSRLSHLPDHPFTPASAK
jgi:hypothetical protein